MASSDYPRLTAEQECVLAKRIEAGDREAAKELAAANLGLVVKASKMFRAKNGNISGREQFGKISSDDLEQEGYLALMWAARGFRSGYGKFSSYAMPCIIHRFIYVLTQVSDGYTVRQLRTPNLENRDDSFHPEVEDHRADRRDAPDVDHADLCEKLMESLLPRQKEAIERYFGLNGRTQETCGEIAKDFGCCKVRVSNIIRDGIKRMQMVAGPEAIGVNTGRRAA